MEIVDGRSPFTRGMALSSGQHQQHKLDYVSVVSALEILYDEHFTKRPGQVHPGHHQPQIFNLEEDDEWNYEWEPTWDSSWMTPVTWDDWEWDEHGGEPDAAGDGDGE